MSTNESLKKLQEISDSLDDLNREVNEELNVHLRTRLAAMIEMNQAAAEAGLPDITLEEINAEIQAVRSSSRRNCAPFEEAVPVLGGDVNTTTP